MIQIKRIATIGGLTLISRILGFSRDILMAASLGAGLAADAFVIAFKLPNFFRRLFAEGAFSAGFIPLYARALSRDETGAAAHRFAEITLSWFLPILLVFLALMEWQMAGVINGLTGGFAGDLEKQAFTIELARITFPYLLLISLVALITGILNSHRRFAAAAAAPILLNIAMISAMLLAPQNDRDVALFLSWGVTIAGAAQLIWLYGALLASGLKLSFALPYWCPEVKDLARTVGPAALGAGIIQLNLLIDIILAARFLPEGAVSWLFYADRLNQLTVGVVGVALSTVLLPDLSRLLARDDIRGCQSSLNRSLWFALLVGIPACTGLVLLADPIIATLFQRGAFTEAIAHETALALIAYALGLPFYLIIKCLTPAFFAAGDTSTPVKIGLVAMMVNLIANLVLIGPMGHVGLALATAISALINAAMLAIILIKRDLFRPDVILGRQTVKTIAAATLMAFYLILILNYFGDFYHESSEELRVATLFGFIILPAIVIFIGFAYLSGLMRPSDLKNLKDKSQNA